MLPQVNGGDLSQVCLQTCKAVGITLSVVPNASRAEAAHYHASQNYEPIHCPLFLSLVDSEMKKTNYSFEKRQREIAKQKKRESKRLKKTEKGDQSEKEGNEEAVD